MKNEFEILRNDIRDSLKKGEPTLTLDRLHTYSVKIIRMFCISHDIDIKNDKNENYPLHSLVGMLSKFYCNNNMVSGFSITVIKTSISIFERFNDIRNNRSFAHDNEILSDQESLFVIKTIMSLLEFINYIETKDPNIMYISTVSKEDIYKCICLNSCITTEEIAKHFNIQVEEIKPLVLELFKVDSLIKKGSFIYNENDDNCQWIKNG